MAYAQTHPQHGSPADIEAGDREPFEVLLHLTADERDALLLASREWSSLESIGDALDELGEQQARATASVWPASWQGRP